MLDNGLDCLLFISIQASYYEFACVRSNLIVCIVQALQGFEFKVLKKVKSQWILTYAGVAILALF